VQLDGGAGAEAGAVQAGQGPRWPSKRQRVRLLSIQDIDQRTHAARNAKQIRAAVIADLGGEEVLSTLQAIMADNAAVLACQLADLKVRWLRGDEIDPAVVATITNVFNRTAAQLGINRQPRDVQDLRSYLAGKADAPADIEEEEVDGPADAEDAAETDMSATPPEEADHEDDDREALPQERRRERGELIDLWPGAALLVDGADAGRFWIVRLEGDHRHPLEWRYTEETARQRAEELRQRGQL
jgi:hypothetical protein